MLATLSTVKAHSGITDTSEDTLLAQLIGVCSDTIRGYAKFWFGAFIASNTLANPTVVTSYSHGLQTGDTISIAGSNSTPTIDGARVVTVIDQNTFSVPVNVTGAGTAGYYSRTFTEFYSGNGTRFLKLKQRPVQSVTSMYLDNSGYWGEGSNAFASTSQLTAGTDFALVRDNGEAIEQSLTGQVAKIAGVWDEPASRPRGMLTATRGVALGNIKATYIAGYMPVPMRYQLACMQMVAQVRSTRTVGGPVQSLSYDYFSVTYGGAAEQAMQVGSVKQLLGDLKEWVW